MIKKFLCSMYLKTKHMLISIRGFNKVHLMDRVIYKGRDCFVNNAIRSDANGNRLYDILPEAFDENGRRKGWSVSRNEFKKKFCWLNIKNDLISHYRWWKDYWYEIDLRKMLEKFDTGLKRGSTAIKIICPHCKEELKIIDNREIYNLNRLGQSLCMCNYCKKTFLIFYDDKEIKAVRISK